MKTLKDFDFKNKKVLVRCDFNVPLGKKGEVIDDSRIKETLPTINYLLEKEAKIILISHLGRPKEIKNKKLKIKKYSLKPVSLKLEELLKQKVYFLNDCIGKKVEKEIEKLKEKEIILLENLRFYNEEEENDEDFIKKLTNLGDIFINEAFSASHRSHSSIVGIPKYLSSGIGFLFEREIKILSNVLDNPWRPLVIIIGGKKINDKIGMIEQFLKSSDHLLLGGEIANVVLINKGVSLGQLFSGEKKIIEKIDKINLTNPKIHVPVDGIISLENIEEEYFRVGAIGSLKKEEKIYDIGEETIKIFSNIIKQAKMILWSGPLGLFEEKKFENGTKEIAKSIVKNYQAFKIAGGGDTIAAINKFGFSDKFDYISTGGGAMLEFLSGEKLPGIEALK